MRWQQLSHLLWDTSHSWDVGATELRLGCNLASAPRGVQRSFASVWMLNTRLRRAAHGARTHMHDARTHVRNARKCAMCATQGCWQQKCNVTQIDNRT